MKLVGVLDLRQNLAEHLSQVALGEDIIIIQRSKPIARLIPYREASMSEERAPYVTARPPSVTNRTPRQHARQLLEEQFDGSKRRLRLYLLRMIEALDDMEDNQP